MNRSMGLAIVFAAILAGSAGAESRCEVVPFNSLENGHDTALAKIGLAAVSGKAPLHFSTCAGPNCPDKPYLMGGDLVVTAATQNGWTCALFPNKVGGTEGWLPTAQLAPQPVAADPPLGAWTGKWQRDRDATIAITVKAAALTIAGEAFWRGSPMNIHTGELEGTAKPKGTLLQLPPAGEKVDPELDCIAEVRLVGPYLLVEDNMHCGGMNVTFTGAYRRVTSGQ